MQLVARSSCRHPPGGDTPPLTVVGPTNCLPQLSWHPGAVKAARQAILFFYVTLLNAALPVPPLRKLTPHQACVYPSLPEVYSVVNPRPDLSVLAGT